MTDFPLSGLIGVDLTATVSATGSASNQGNQFALGTCVMGKGNKYMYVLSSGAITQYAAVAVDEDFKARPLTKALADQGQRVGAAQVAIPATSFGWVAYEGMDISVRARASCAADAPLYTTASAGVLDDTATSQTKIIGITLTSANGGATAATPAIAVAVHADVS